VWICKQHLHFGKCLLSPSSVSGNPGGGTSLLRNNGNYSPVDKVYTALKTCNMAVITKNLATIPNLPLFIPSTLASI
jgi:hypothetical protein